MKIGYEDIVELIKARSKSSKFITFIREGGNETVSEYGRLIGEAFSLAADLREAGFSPEDEVIFQFSENRNFVVALWACFAAGFVPVIVNPVKDPESAKKLANVINKLNRPALLTDEAGRAIFSSFPDLNLKDFSGKIYNVGDAQNELSDFDFIKPDPDSTAFIQFSSGSTGEPKGVIVSHKNLISNVAAMLEAIECDDDEIFLSWAPLTHSSGMILSLMNAFAGDFNLFLMEKRAFLADPVYWIEKADQARATFIFSPNFGYKYFIDALSSEKDYGWDLSCVKHIMNGSEQISAALAERFNSALFRYKLSPKAMTPIYGLAESTLAVSVGKRSDRLEAIFVDREKLNVGDEVEIYKNPTKDKAIELVKLGVPVPGASLRLADASGNILPGCRVGTLQIKSDSIVSGYVNDEESTSALITPDGWLNTGDLAFIFEGELVVAGKTKEVIIVNGINHYPVDLERIAANAVGEDFSKFVASSYYDGSKQKEIVVLGCVYTGDLAAFYKYFEKIKSEILRKAAIEMDFIIPIDEIPKNNSGKVQRLLFGENFRKGAYAGAVAKLNFIESKSGVRSEALFLDKRRVAELVLKTAEEMLGKSVDLNIGLVSQGFNSMMALSFSKKLSQAIDFNLPVSLVFDYINVRDIADYIYNELNKSSAARSTYKVNASIRNDEPVAVIGVGIRFPGNVEDPDEFWSRLASGEDFIRKTPAGRWSPEDYRDAKERKRIEEIPPYGAYVEDWEMFDNRFFGITPREAESMDPQQRLLLETSYRAIEDAGIKLSDVFGSDSGVFIGLANSDYMQAEVKSGRASDINIFSLTGSAPCAAAGRLSYFYGFHGPSVVFDTACSSSFSALHHAVRSLQSGEVPLALLGGVNLILTPEFHVGLNEMGVLSPDGRCKVFDDSANGYVRSEGCAVMLLKRLSDAVENGDKIHGVILGSAVNHDGRSAGLAAPNGKAQIDVMEKALAAAGLTPDDIDYFEAHGTGTAIGDVQEVNSISRVYRDRKENLLLGSVKSNIGHLEACSGLAGLIKVLASFRKRVVPGNINFEKPNSDIPWNDIKIEIASRNVPLPKDKKLRASINSFGFSGTNVNVIVEEPPKLSERSDDWTEAVSLSHYALPISAQTRESLLHLSKAYAESLGQCDLKSLIGGVCERRSDFGERLVIVGRDANELKHALQSFSEGESTPSIATAASSSPDVGTEVVFQFSGGGSQRAQMGRELYETAPIFRENFDACAREFEKHTKIPIAELIFNEGPLSENLEYAHPYLFAFEYALAKLWISWGVAPSAVVGHSIGEYAAACIAGIFSLGDACKLVANRARLMESVNGNGLMCAVFADENTVKKHFNGSAQKVDAAVINSEENIVISGEKESILVIIEKLRENNIETKILKVSLASHSRMMQPILDEYEKIVGEVELHEPLCAYMSNMTGLPVSRGEATSPKYWADQIRNCVRFGDSLTHLINDGYRIFLEIGPSPVLSGIGLQSYPDLEALWLPSLDKKTTEWEQLLICAAELYINHYSINWRKILDLGRSSNAELPKYPFERHAFWKSPLLANGPERKSKSLQILNAKRIIERKNNGEIKMDVLSELKNMIFDLTGNRPGDTDNDKLIFQLGLDSLILVKLRQGIKRKFDVEIGMSKIFKELNSLRKMSSHIESNSDKLISPVAAIDPEIVGNEVPEAASAFVNVGDSVLADVFKEQFNLMNRQLDLLKSSRAAIPTSPEPVHDEPKKKSRPSPVNFRSVKLDSDETLSPSQKRYIDNLISEYSRKTKRSGEYAQKYRRPLSDWINTLSYRHELKKMSYPFVVDRAEGCKVFDIDGNEYIDIANGYGVHFFGHKPLFIFDAISREMTAGCAIGPQSRIVGETAELLCSITGNERATFCNTGTEAVMVAIRLARAKTGRDKIVIFSGSYHGTYDGVLAVADENSEVHPVSSGVPENMTRDVYVLEYGSDSALEFIRERGQELAAVICEPVQSRKPSLQPRAFLRKLRDITVNSGCALIFDEIVTGFRISPGGCQEHFGVRADIVTYGKIAGGGMPIGVVSGKAAYLDMIDGGFWDFGDDSAPSSNITFFGGTFCKHPFAMAACNAVMKKIKDEGTALYDGINNLTTDFVENLNRLFKTESIPFSCSHFASQFRIDGEGVYSSVLKPIELDLFFYSMINKGVYFWERKINFFSVEITSKETEHILSAAGETLREMKAAGFFRNDGNTGACILPSDSVELFQATSAQKRMFVLGQYDGGELAYHITLPFVLCGEPDISKLENAFNRVIRKHDTLRSVFYSKGGRVLQEIKSDFEFELFRIGRTADEDIHETIRGFIRPFDFASAPLIRAGYCPLEPGKTLLVIDVHHIIADGVSLGILFDELSKFYGGEESNDIPAASRDLSKSEKEYLQSYEYEVSKRYLLNKFGGELPTFELPATGSRKSSHNFSGNQWHFCADKELTESLKSLAGELNVTLYSVLVGAFYIFLNKSTRGEDFIIGIPVSSRPEDGALDYFIGMTANTIPMRCKPKNDALVSEFLRETQSEILAANEHNRFPLDELTQALGVSRQADRNPLFDLLFVYENAEGRELNLGGIRAERFKYVKRTTMSDFVLEAIYENDVINMSIEYDDNLFNSQIIETFAGRYLDILRSIISTDKKISDIDVLSTVTREKLASGLSRAAVEIIDRSAIDAFSSAVRSRPNKPAVICKGEALTYGELEERSNRIAEAILKNFSPRKGDIAAIYMDRGLNLPAALLAVMKCGMAYLPLNKDYPKERINQLIKAGKSALVITDERPDWADNSIVIDGNNIRIERLEGSAPPPENAGAMEEATIHPEDLAYLYFTSGSTGEPKGVMIKHENLLSFKENFYPVWGIAENDIIYAITPITFDISNLEILCSLLNGLTIVIGTEEEINNVDLFVESMIKYGVNTLQITPSRLSLMINEIGADFIGSLKTLLVGGEELPKSLHKRLSEIRNVKIFNVYGPTETTIWSTSFQISRNSAAIGTPLINESVYVLDEGLNLLPPYTVGEICIGGAGVGAGYWGNSGLTRQSFAPNPFAPGSLYRTGDMGRINSEFELEFIGRNDGQVKINGLRIELKEIEACADAFPGVRRCVCVAKEDGDAKYLVAFFAGEDINISNLKNYISARLPRYMVPNIIRRIGEIPLSANGKIDRKALAAWDLARGSEKRIILPANESERVLVKVLHEILRTEEISTDSNFFEIGGDSIKAIQLISELYRAGKSIELKEVLRRPVLSEMAAYIGDIDAAVSAGDSDRLTPAQEAIYYSCVGKSGSTYSERLSFEIEGEVTPKSYEKAWREIVERHDVFRMNFTADEFGEVKRIYKDREEFKVEYIEISDSLENIKSGLLRRDLEKSFDLENDRLIRVYLVKMGYRKYFTLISFHHIILDGWSHGLLFDELKKIYTAIENGYAPALEPPFRFNDFTSWLAGRDNTGDEVFWKNYLKGYKPDRQIITSDETAEIIEYGFSVERSQSEELRDYAKSLGVALSAVITTAWAAAFASSFGTSDVLFGATFSGRQAPVPNIANGVGLFINTAPVRITMDNNLRADEIVKLNHNNLIEINRHGFYSAEQIRCDCGFDFSLIDHTLVIENYQHTDLQFAEGLEVKNVGFSERTDFGLTVYVAPDDEITVKAASCVADRRLSNVIPDLIEEFKQNLNTTVLKSSFPGDSARSGNLNNGISECPVASEVCDSNNEIIRGEEFLESLTAVFSGILGKDKIGADSDFFENGGHSLKAIKLISAVYKRTGIKLDFKDVLSNPTANALARALAAKKHEEKALKVNTAAKEYYELSLAQKRLWLIDNKHGNSGAYNVCGSLKLRGELDVEAFSETINIIIARHGAFRTSFKKVNGEPKQFVESTVPFKINRLDFHAESDPNKAAQDYVNEHYVIDFNLTRAPLLHIALLYLGSPGGVKEFVMFFKVHHIIFDGWSNEILLNELSTIYNSLIKGIKPVLEPLSAVYTDYSGKIVGDADLSEYRDFWLERMEEFPGNFAVPTDFPRSNKASFEGRAHILRLDKLLHGSLEELCETGRYSLFDIVASAVYILMFIESSQKDITLGIPLSGRIDPEFAGAIGYFINTMPLRLKLSGEKQVCELICELRDEIALMNANQAYPFDKLVEEMDLRYNGFGSPVFDIIINSYSADLDALSLDGVESSIFGQSLFFSKYDLQFYYEEKENINIIIEYKTALFKSETIERYANGIKTILETISGSHTCTIDEIRQELKPQDKISEEEDFRNSLLFVSEDF